MLVIRLEGGMGNQMFQYALYLKLRALGKTVFCDTYMLEAQKLMKLTSVFHIQIPPATPAHFQQLQDGFAGMPWGSAMLCIKWMDCIVPVYGDTSTGYQPEIYDLDDRYLIGYWQSEKYFSDIEAQVRDTFRFKNALSPYQQDILRQITSCESVSIHIRRGDYLNFPEVFGNICTEEYYANAINRFSQRDNVRFFIFSNDYAYAKQHYQGEQFIVVKAEQAEPFCENDMYLMSRCKHHILANSSYSWWGAWLNPNPDKIVISPRKWVNDRDMHDIHCPSWLRI